MGNVGDLSYVVMRLAAEPITITSRTAGSNDGAGHYVLGSSSTVSVTANVQPASGRDLLRLEEGFRTREVIAIFSRGALNCANATTGTPADVITRAGGVKYEVQHSEPWPHGNLYRSIAIKAGA